MNRYILLLLVAGFCCSCKVLSPSRKTVYRQQPELSKTGSCSMEAHIIKVLRPDRAALQDKNDPCAFHPCRAQAVVNDISGCGAGVSVAANPGDTVWLRFAYTLDATDRVFPDMHDKYPGLKPGSTFQATVQQRLAPGRGGEFVVYGYKIK